MKGLLSLLKKGQEPGDDSEPEKEAPPEGESKMQALVSLLKKMEAPPGIGEAAAIPAEPSPEPPPSAPEELSSGSEPLPPEGAPVAGSEPLPAGSAPPTAGAEPLPAGSEPPVAGSEPTPAGSEPQPEGTLPPPEGSAPPTAGTDSDTSSSDPFRTAHVRRKGPSSDPSSPTGTPGGIVNMKLATRVFGTMSSNVLTAYLGFKDPKRKRREYLIPKDKAAWLEWMVHMTKKRIQVDYLTDKELKKVIIRARPNLPTYKKPQNPTVDPDVPPCLKWDEKEVGDWIASIGYGRLKETFVKNVITGRRLILVDCTALNKMGMTNLAAMREVAGKIRELLGIPQPNQMRAMMRLPPYERFLRRKVYSGQSYDDLTFEKFCVQEGYNYELVSKNRNMLIPCTVDVTVTTIDNVDPEDQLDGESDEGHSLRNAPTVEFLVRNAMVRNKTLDQIMEDIMASVFLPAKERKYGKDLWCKLKRGLGEGYDDLHLHHPKERLEFASGVAHSLIDELYRTVLCLNDLGELKKYIKENITKEDMDMFRSCAQTLLEEALPLVSLLVMGDLDMEAIFRQEPQFQQFVKGIINKAEMQIDEQVTEAKKEVGRIVRDAEQKTNELVPDTKELIDLVISEALRKLPEKDLAPFKIEVKESILKMVDNMQAHLNDEKKEGGAQPDPSSTDNKGEASQQQQQQQQEGATDKGKGGARQPSKAGPGKKQPAWGKHPGGKEPPGKEKDAKKKGGKKEAPGKEAQGEEAPPPAEDQPAGEEAPTGDDQPPVDSSATEVAGKKAKKEKKKGKKEAAEEGKEGAQPDDVPPLTGEEQPPAAGEETPGKEAPEKKKKKKGKKEAAAAAATEETPENDKEALENDKQTFEKVKEILQKAKGD